MSTYSPFRLAAALLATVVGFCCVFWPPGPLDESPWYALGPLMLGFGSAALATQCTLRPRDPERGASPAEVGAWIALACVAAMVAYILVNASVLMESWLEPATRHVGIKLVMILVLWIVASAVVRARNGTAVMEDERDRQIASRASGLGRGALLFSVMGVVGILGFSPADRLLWVTPAAVATLLVFALLWGWLVEYAAMAMLYLYDRRAAR